jgi:hypothetical protein
MDKNPDRLDLPEPPPFNDLEVVRRLCPTKTVAVRLFQRNRSDADDRHYLPLSLGWLPFQNCMISITVVLAERIRIKKSTIGEKIGRNYA